MITNRLPRTVMLIVTLFAQPCIAKVVEVHSNEVAEFVFTATKVHADAFNDVDLDVVFTAPDKSEKHIPAFWSGGNIWRARYSSPQIGLHHLKTICADVSDTGLHNIERDLLVSKYTDDNPLYLHGPLRVAADKIHFEHLDGTPFFWLGDTWWMGLTNRLHWPDEFATLTKDRAEKGFTVVQIVAGLYPDMPAFDERGANEAGFPWEKDYARIRPEYFDAADRRIAHLVDNGIAPCIVGAWGYHLPWLGVEKMKKHWRYIIARWGAYPGFWCVAGEGAMPYYLSTDKPKDAEFQKHGWTEIAEYIRKTDPFAHPISIHPTDFSRTNVTDASALDFEMLQTGHGDRGSIGPTIRMVRRSREMQPPMPTINAEVCYEGILGKCHDDVVRIVTWSSLLGGTAGHTYGANGIWQMNRKDQPYGKSPHGGTYGPTPWDEAMNLPGSLQVGFAKKLLERFDWWKFEPHPEWAAWADESEPTKWGDWIWHENDGDASHDAPAAKRSFRKTFEIAADVKIERAIVQLTVDDHFVASVNGTKVGRSDKIIESWRHPKRFDIAPLLKPGENTLEVEAENIAADVPNNPAGLLCAGEIVFAGEKTISLASDASWQTSTDGKSWSAAKVIAKYGQPPWGDLSPAGAPIPPIAAGIPDRVRIVYLAEPKSVRVMPLNREIGWQAECFDPVTGRTSHITGIETFTPPPDVEHDWVLVLTRQP